MSLSVWAIVTTWNRRALLARCLEALERQTRPCDAILVVDNASTDGTDLWLAGRGGVRTLRLETNTGGAGGFNTGMRAAMAEGAQALWLMDDDVVPEPDALERLLDAQATLAERGVDPAFLCSVARTGEGALTNTAEVDPRLNAFGYAAWGEHLDHGLVAANQATFVSLLVSRQAVHAAGLPLAPMFIWGDDTEYTRRLARTQAGFVVGGSRVTHLRAAPGALSVKTERDPARLRLHRLLVRNVILSKRRHEGGRATARYVASRLRIGLRLAAQGRMRAAWTMVAGVAAGLRFDPEVEYWDR